MTQQELQNEFDSYYSLTEQKFKLINDSLQSMGMDIKEIKNNHLEHLKSEMMDCHDSITKLDYNQRWIIAIGAFIMSGVLAIIIKLIF